MTDDIPDHVFEDPEPEPEQCEICNRFISTTTHHLVPKDKSSETIEACNPCHKQIHAAFTNHELRHEFNTVEKLRNATRLQEFITWIQKTDKTDIQVRESTDVNRWRR